MRRIRIHDYIKLSRRRHIAQLIAASHQHDLFYFGNDLRTQPHRHRQICHRPRCDHRDIPFRFQQCIYDELHAVLLFRSPCQRCKNRAVHTALPVDIPCHHLFFSDHRLLASLIDRYIQIQILTNIQRILYCFLHRLISRRHRYTKQLKHIAFRRKHDRYRVVMPRITVQNNFSFIHIHILLI